MKDIHEQRILILDFGSQTTQLIARRVRECGVYCEIHPYDITAQVIVDFKPSGIILSGGPETTTAEAAPSIPEQVFQDGCPVLGICYGLQAMICHFGGTVVASQHQEYGHAQLRHYQASRLLTALSDGRDEAGDYLDVWMSHGDSVSKIPEDFEVVAQTDRAPMAVVQHKQQPWFGLQFHPEVTHTRQSKQIISRFVLDICGCSGDWTTDNIIEASLEACRTQVGDDQVILGLSGGVDSSVVAALLHRAIGDQLTCVFVDTGLLRYQEAEQVVATFQQNLGLKLIHVDAGERFLQALSGVTCPEEKRKIVGKLFVDVFQEQASQLGDVAWLAQGTIYPDVIESAASTTGKAKLIKSHHNVGGLPESMHLKVIEPLRELFKDEVRQMGVALGLPKEMVYRHPFPGPGLSVRILGDVQAEQVTLLQKADHIFLQALREYELYDEVSQAFAVFLPVKSVAVKGDGRCYDYVIALRAVKTIDFMTAKWAELPYDFLQHVSNRIINEVHGISRVVYDISSKPPATIEWE